MFSENLKSRLVFLFFALILLTNLIFAVVAVSREKIQTGEKLLQSAIFLGKILISPAEKLLLGDSKKRFNEILDRRSGLINELKVTLYDKNWWKKAGEDIRIPLEGFPSFSQENSVVIKTGPKGISREVFIPISNEMGRIGAIGIGIPVTDNLTSGASPMDFVLILLINLLLGIVAAIILSRSILQPLNGLMEGIYAFTAGNYAHRVATNGSGELKQLCKTFNRMASTVQENAKENLMRNRMLDEKIQELWEIYELTRSMSVNLKLESILQVFMEKAQTLSFSSSSQIVLPNSVTGKLEAVIQDEELPDLKLEDYENGLNRCFLNGEPEEVNSSNYSVLFLPLLAAGKVQGVLFLAKHDNAVYSATIKRFLLTIAPVAGSMIENARLYESLSEWNTNVNNILSSVHSGLAAIDLRGRFIIVNQTFKKFFPEINFSLEESNIQKLYNNIKDSDFALIFKNSCDEFILNDKGSKIENMILRRTAELITADRTMEVELRIMPLHEGNKVRGSVIVLEDITEQKQFEQQMVESEKWAVLGRLAASVAHEIRNPLVAIRSLVEIIGDEVQGDLKEHVTVILGEVHRLNRVVVELLSMIKPEQAQMQVKELKDIINELIVLVRHEAARNGISIKTELPELPCELRVDPEKLKQAFLNIILNAIQAVGNGGTIEIKIHKNDRKIIIDFINDGPKIEESVLEHIFEPFYTTKGNGTGLGLAITRKIVQLHNGCIEVHSNNESTVFTFLLPMETD
ncbi:MAG: ATP-binding protein [Candidatus Rifleibacteriota bacterium]